MGTNDDRGHPFLDQAERMALYLYLKQMPPRDIAGLHLDLQLAAENVLAGDTVKAAVALAAVLRALQVWPEQGD